MQPVRHALDLLIVTSLSALLMAPVSCLILGPMQVRQQGRLWEQA